MITVALVGRPNSGKSSLYNQLTGGNARVGNYPGITVEVLEGDVSLPSGAAAKVADLPGLYSVEATVAKDTDEGVARAFIDSLSAARKSSESDTSYVVVQVIDPTRLALGLRLTRELAKQKVPLVVALTHRDVLKSEGREVDVEKLETAIGAKVVLVSAREAGCKDAIFAAVDDRVRDTDPPDPIGDFDPIKVAHDVVRELEATAEISRRRKLTERLDAVLLHPLVGPFLFVGLMALVFAAVFLIADPVTSLCDLLIGYAKSGITRVAGDGMLASFLTDGVLGGAGTVLAFAPQIVILTVALELFEASGYLARGAFLVDRLLRLLGLSGRSFLPLLMGHACAIPAIGATRVVRDPRERLTTILVIPLMTCSARLPTYALILSTFFGGRSALFRAGLFVGLYFFGIFSALVASLVLRRTATKGRGLPLVLEMPSYRVPQASVVVRKAWNAGKRFVRDVGRIIVGVSAVLWVLLTVPMPGVEKTERPIDSSIAAMVGRAIEPVTRPAGFDWKMDVGLIGAFGAREVFVATLGVVYGIEDAADDLDSSAPLAEKLHDAKKPDGSPVYTMRTGLALLVFFVLACQCMSTVAAIRRETQSWRWPAFVLAYTYAAGYVAAVVVYQVSGLFGLS